MDVTCQIHERYWDTTGVKDETHWNWKCLRFLQIDQWPRRPCWANWGAFTIRWVFFHRPWQKENIFTEKYARRKKGWNEEVSPDLKTKWFRWKGQLRNVQVPRSINRECRRTKSIHIRKFADCKQPSLFHSNHSSSGDHDRNNERNLNVQVENIQAQHFHRSFGVSQWAYGGQWGEKRLPSTKAKANILGDDMDGQYGYTVLDHKRRASLESIHCQGKSRKPQRKLKSKESCGSWK